MKKYILPILFMSLLYWSCEEETEPKDCAGVEGGNALLDNCGTCDDDPSNDCLEDCADVWGGTAVVDNCGVCDDDPSNDCLEDCADVWGGTAVVDNCGVCDDDPSNDCIQDCEGVWGGHAELDECGECNGPGLVEYYDCEGNCINDLDGDLVCDELEIEGCTDTSACNYDYTATENIVDLCEYPEEFYDCDGFCIAEGEHLNDQGYDDCEICGGDGFNEPDSCCDGEVRIGFIDDCHDWPWYMTNGCLTSSGCLNIESTTYITCNEACNFSGEIPTSIGTLINLETITIRNASLTGEIPDEIGDLINLGSLKIDGNDLSGVVPESICDLNINWSDSWVFNIQYNQLCPPYPSCIEPFIGIQDTTNCDN